MTAALVPRTRRRALRCALGAAAGMLMLAGCPSSSETSEPGAQPPSASELPPCPTGALAEATGPVEVLVWYQLNGKTRDTFVELIDRYNASQTKVKVRAEIQGADYDELFDAYKRGIPSGELPDIVVTDETATRFLVDSGTVVAAQKCFEADGLPTDGFNQAAINYYRVGGVLYPASVSLSDLVTYYNKAHFLRAGLDPEQAPGTLTEVRATAEKLKAAGVTDQPVVFKLAPWFLETQLTGAGQSLVDNDNGHGPDRTTKATFDTDTSREVYQWVAEMVRDGLLNAKADTPAQFDHLFAMTQQTASITVETSTAITTIAAYFGGDTSVADDIPVQGSTNLTRADAGVGPMFGVSAPGKSQVGGNAFFITNAGGDADVAGAWDFMKWWNQPAQQKVWHMEGSYLPFLTELATDPQVQAFWRDDFAGQLLKVASDEVATGMDPDFPGAAIGPYRETRDAIRASLDRVALAGGEPDAALRDAVAEVDAALRSYNEGL